MEKFIPVAEPALNGNEKKYVMDCIDSTWISSLGKYIPEFEKEFAKFCNAKRGVAVANGTVALQLALAALGIKPGDEVIVPDFTFVATANAVTYLGAKPVFVDCDKTWNIDPEKIEEKITTRTKAIIPVHLYGHPCDMDKIMQIAKKHSLFVIEDAAEAHGAKYKGRMVGSMGDVSCFSFYGNKIITTGEGGMCLTNDDKLADKMQFLKDHGMSAEKRYWHPVIGYNFRMTNIQAALGLAQLEYVDKILSKKSEIAGWYNSYLRDVKGITFMQDHHFAEPVCWLYSILINEDFGITRDELIKKLKEQQIDSRPFFYPMHELPPYKSDESFPNATKLSRTGMNLPTSVNLAKEDILRICNAIRNSQ